MDQVAVCVYCRRRPVDPQFQPFCSDRCRLLDLSHWIDGTYRVPAEPLPEPGPVAVDRDDQPS